jgi:hypothetical protein
MFDLFYGQLLARKHNSPASDKINILKREPCLRQTGRNTIGPGPG